MLGISEYVAGSIPLNNSEFAVQSCWRYEIQSLLFYGFCFSVISALRISLPLGLSEFVLQLFPLMKFRVYFIQKCNLSSAYM